MAHVLANQCAITCFVVKFFHRKRDFSSKICIFSAHLCTKMQKKSIIKGHKGILRRRRRRIFFRPLKHYILWHFLDRLRGGGSIAGFRPQGDGGRLQGPRWKGVKNHPGSEPFSAASHPKICNRNPHLNPRSWNRKLSLRKNRKETPLGRRLGTPWLNHHREISGNVSKIWNILAVIRSEYSIHQYFS